MPSTPIHFEGDPTPIGEILPYVGTWPSTNVVEVESNSYRGNTIGKIAVAPLQYNYETGELYFAKIINIRIPFEQIGVNKMRALTQSATSKTTKGNLDEFLTISNPSLSEQTKDEIKLKNEISPNGITLPSLNLGTVAPTLLIVTPDEFKEEAEKFAETKSRLGYSVVIESASTETLQKPTEVFKIIKRAYDWHGNVEHVLLFGGGNFIRPFDGELKPYIDTRIRDYVTDYYYSCLDAEHEDLIDDPYCLENPEYTPDYSINEQDRMGDVTLGRFPAHSLEEIQNMVEKSINYEINPPINDACYFYDSVHFAESSGKVDATYKDDYIFIRSIEKLDEALHQSHNNVETEPRRFYYSPKTREIAKKYYDGYEMPEYVIQFLEEDFHHEDIINELNSGCSYLLYRGHADVKNWSFSSFSSNALENLKNENKYPGIYAITCLSGRFYHSDDNSSTHTHSLCESFLSGKRKGAAFAIGADNNSISGFNEYLMAGIFNAMYPWVLPNFSIQGVTNPIQHSYPYCSELGLIFQRGEETMTSMYFSPAHWFTNEISVKDFPRYNKEIYHCLGDPTLKVYRFKPQQYYPTILKIGKSLRVFHKGLKLVAKRKGQHETAFFPPATGDYYDIADLVDSFDLSLIGDGYVPVFINSEGLTSTTATPDLKIESVSNYGSQTKISYNSDNEEVNFKLYDIYGNLVDETVGDNGNAYLKSIDAFSVIVMEKDGVAVDSKRIINK